MSIKEKKFTLLSHNIKSNTRVLTSIIKESKLNKLILIVESIYSNITNINNRLDNL